ncbi:MAG: bifunctional demethylmenaquinone methyltransferase/2-methoxy-6-polyprenyl-1,4-benzoquinol methylase UbiE [Candidatus Tectomicrobia bacterium]|uniref:Demethylmenaquinone methyltransferase n=1 Tax=Tectimicrobiota bacterium TaxID=2528274 RepID=A0A933LPN9_UNCTE|nr:bifunctional demethylmenaquinone methyltransferase/2-methoxy-6-polyprenyl-1,4-benzoquinol methylase UbiE [Candidatus Tectomicrobia bacterium]
MFDNIAPWYDFLNRLLSLRRDVYWRRFTADRVLVGETCRVLDVACGTCDIALEVLRSQPCVNRVVGVDFSPNMLSRAKLKTGDTNQKIQLGLADALHLPFKDASFDNCIIAFGIRNIVSRREALEEMARVLVTGGQVMVLEFATPRRRLFKNIYLFYLDRILPFIGGFFSKHKNAYQYLSDTILSFPDPDKFAQLMEEAGLKDVTYHKLTFGIVNLHIGRKA